jgi:hypothetical protein
MERRAKNPVLAGMTRKEVMLLAEIGKSEREALSAEARKITVAHTNAYGAGKH